METLITAFSTEIYILYKLNNTKCPDGKIKILHKSPAGFAVHAIWTTATKIPAIIEKQFKERKTIKEETWRISQNKAEGEYKISLVGNPISLHCRCEIIRNTNKTCTLTINSTVDVDIPLIGSKLARIIAKISEDALDQEYEFISSHPPLEGGAPPP